MASKQGTIKIYKNKGETPLECIKRFKKDNPEYKDEKMTYAGRLDPLAEGLLLVLVGEECKNKEKYLVLDKEYELDILLGFSTDTYDILGKVTEVFNKTFVIPVKTDIQNIMNSFVGKFFQKYPLYSSKTLNGKHLFEYAKEGSLDSEEIPEKEVEIKKIEILDYKKIEKTDFERKIEDSILSVSGDFRQDDILKSWKESLVASSLDEYGIISIKVVCTSGTYMRSLANSFGLKIKIPSLAFRIKRNKIGDFKL